MAEFQPPTPDPALKRFDRLIGKWDMTGRTLDATADNITGWNTFEWISGGFFLKSEGEINFNGTLVQSLEVIGYDAERKQFTSQVYSNMSGDGLPYTWDVQGDTVIHADASSTYTGTFSEDGNTLSGGWRQNDGNLDADGANYDATMTRVT